MFIKKIVNFIFILTLLLYLPKIFSTVYAAREPIQGVTCGVAGADEGDDKCCFIPLPLTTPPPDQETINRINNANKESQTLCAYGEPSSQDVSSCKCILANVSAESKPLEKICNRLSFENKTEKQKCINCAEGGGIWSGLGCVPLGLGNFITDYVFKIGIGLAGIFSLLCIIYSAILLQTSQGNPERIKRARGYLTNCIMGLVLILASVFILQLIGVNILGIDFTNLR